MTSGLYQLDDVTPETPDSGEYWIAPGAAVIGKVRLAAGASVWFNAALRGDNEWITLGEGSNIQENAVLHTDPGCPLTIGANVTVGHGAIVHGCTIEDGVLIGMGATILNRAVIGAGSLVAANALVPEGRTYPPRSLILGAPAKPARDLTDEEVARNLEAAVRYRANAARFKSGLRPV